VSDTQRFKLDSNRPVAHTVKVADHLLPAMAPEVVLFSEDTPGPTWRLLKPKSRRVVVDGKLMTAYDAHQLLESLSETPRPGRFYE
jgi:hypothetical protein